MRKRNRTKKREQTQREVLLDVCNEPIASLDALVEQCHRALSAELWTTCSWPDSPDWKIGDFNYLIVSARPDAETSLYVQFWSEPGEGVLSEVGSGEWCPGAIRYIGPTQRKVLEARGYAIGGRARNYQKTLVIDSAASAEAAALEVLQIAFEVFGYRGQWPLEIERHQGERADHALVYTSISPEDFAKVATRAGCRATVTNSEGPPVVALARGRRKFLACMDWRVPRQNLGALVVLQAELTLKQPVSDEVISHVNSTMRLVKVLHTDDRVVCLQMPLVLDGGVTEAWLAKSLQHWLRSWRTCERLLKRAVVPAKQHQTSQGSELVH